MTSGWERRNARRLGIQHKGRKGGTKSTKEARRSAGRIDLLRTRIRAMEVIFEFKRRSGGLNVGGGKLCAESLEWEGEIA